MCFHFFFSLNGTGAKVQVSSILLDAGTLTHSLLGHAGELSGGRLWGEDSG